MEDKIVICIPNRLECLRWLYPVCEAVLRELPFSENYRLKLMVAISEGFTNAYLHGNQQKPEARIDLSLYIGKNSLKILIEDSAILPIKDTVNQDKDIVDPLAVNGRGMYLMKKIADEAYYEYDPAGINRLVIISSYENKHEDITV